MMRCQTTSARSWPKAMMLSYLPTSRDPCGISRNAPRHRVVDVLGDLGDDEAGQIGVEPADQAGGDDGAGHQLVGRDRRLQGVRIVDVLLGPALQEGELARLVGRRCVAGAIEVPRPALGRGRRRAGRTAWSGRRPLRRDRPRRLGPRALVRRLRLRRLRLELQPKEHLASRAPGRPCGRAARSPRASASSAAPTTAAVSLGTPAGQLCGSSVFLSGCTPS